MMGWDRQTGIPSRAKVQELDIEWALESERSQAGTC